jgi:hypothetical protein
VRVERGNYTVRVSAPGYQDYLAAVNVAGPTAITAVLQGNLFQLAVNCNVAGAQIYVNNALVGAAPFIGGFVPGSYAVRASAPGYTDASTVIHLSRNETLNLVLQSALVSVQIVIPRDFIDRRRGDSGGKDREQIRLFVDGQPYDELSFSLTPGTHNLRLAIGGISLAADYDFAAGRSYVLEPLFGWGLRQ